jgi:hypothetical protein
MIKEFSAFLTLFKQGKSLANSATWKNRTVATNSLIAVLGAGAAIGKGFGYDIAVDDQTLSAAGAGIAAVVCIVNSIMHVITSDKVGLPSNGDVGPSADDATANPGPG